MKVYLKEMENRLQKFNELYEEYRRLVALTHIEAQMMGHDHTYQVIYIKPEDLMRRKVLARELVENYKDLFEGSLTVWFEIQRDI